jgi:hypothetical protein
MKSHVTQSVIGGVWLGVAALLTAPMRAGEPAPPVSVAQSDPTASETNSPPVASPVEIAAWIAELEDHRYLVREQATRCLLLAGAPALDPLLAAANGDGVERADRATEILRHFSAAKDPVFRRQALERLVAVKHRPRVSAAASQALAVMRHEAAVAEIEKLGGRFTSPKFGSGDASTAPYRTRFVVLDNQWRGGDAGLALLADLLGLQHVVVVGSDISLTGLTKLQKVEQLEQLWLYGTKLEPEDLEKVQILLPQVSLDYRRGGLLGVRGSTFDGTGPALVSGVEKGSAAEAAGLKPGDVIQQLNGEQIGTFKELTTKIGQLPAGDEIMLDVLRDAKPMSFTLKLGQWQTI